MSDRRWAYVDKQVLCNPKYREKKEAFLKGNNPDWEKQIEQMRNFIAQKHHDYSITFEYIGVPNAKTYTRIAVKSVEYDRESDEMIVTLWEQGKEKIVRLIELEVWNFYDTYFPPVSPEEMAKVSFC